MTKKHFRISSKLLFLANAWNMANREDCEFSEQVSAANQFLTACREGI